MSKARVQLVGEDGNIFSILGRCRREMRRVGQLDQFNEMSDKVQSCKSYDEALQVIMEYVEVE